MKYTFFLLFLFLPLIVKAADLQTVRHCLDSLQSPQDGDAYKRQVEVCFEKAKTFAESPSVSGKALYFRALAFKRNLAWDGTRSFFQAMSDEMQNYYKTHLHNSLQSGRLHRLTNRSLEDALEAVDQGLFYPSIVYADPLGPEQEVLIFRQLEKRHRASQEQATKVFGTLLRNSEWKLAQELTERWPRLGRLPKIVSENSQRTEELGYFVVSSDLNTLLLKRFYLTKGPSVLIFGDCHFAIDAFRELSARPAFVTAMLEHGLVTGSPDNIDFAHIDLLRKQFPAFEIHPLYKTGAWFQRGFNNTVGPNFAFLMDGKIVHAFEGGVPNLQKEFCLGLNRIGLISIRDCE